MHKIDKLTTSHPPSAKKRGCILNNHNVLLIIYTCFYIKGTNHQVLPLLKIGVDVFDVLCNKLGS